MFGRNILLTVLFLGLSVGLSVMGYEGRSPESVVEEYLEVMTSNEEGLRLSATEHLITGERYELKSESASYEYFEEYLDEDLSSEVYQETESFVYWLNNLDYDVKPEVLSQREDGVTVVGVEYTKLDGEDFWWHVAMSDSNGVEDMDELLDDISRRIVTDEIYLEEVDGEWKIDEAGVLDNILVLSRGDNM